jgi:hypothetical protein
MTLSDIHKQMIDRVFEKLEEYIIKTDNPDWGIVAARDNLSKLLDILQEKSYEVTFTKEEIYKIINNISNPKLKE